MLGNGGLSFWLWTKYFLPEWLEKFKEPNPYQQLSSGYSSMKGAIRANRVNKLGDLNDKYSSSVSIRAESASRGPHWDLMRLVTNGTLHSLITSLQCCHVGAPLADLLDNQLWFTTCHSFSNPAGDDDNSTILISTIYWEPTMWKALYSAFYVLFLIQSSDPIDQVAIMYILQMNKLRWPQLKHLV